MELNITPCGTYRCGLSKILALFNDSLWCRSRNGNGGESYILKFFGSKIPDNNRFEKVVTDAEVEIISICPPPRALSFLVRRWYFCLSVWRGGGGLISGAVTFIIL